MHDLFSAYENGMVIRVETVKMLGQTHPEYEVGTPPESGAESDEATIPAIWGYCGNLSIDCTGRH